MAKGLTQEDAIRLQRGQDFEVFCEEICGIRLNRAQKRIARRLRVGPDRKWRFKTGHIVAANQIGKTLVTALIILWACCYKIGIDPRDTEGWLHAAYLWLHLGPVQQQAYHALKDIRRIIKNEHPAQYDDAAKKTRGRFPTALVEETKVEKYYDGLVFWNGAEAHFRTGENKAEAILGYRAAGISVDECAFLDHLAVIVDEVLYMRLIASKGPLLLISTPNGMNDFFDFVDAVRSTGLEPKGETEGMVWELGDRWLVWAFIDDNLGYGIDAEEIERMERTINPATKEQQLRGAFLEPAEAFFVPQAQILAAFDNSLPQEQQPVPGHVYVEFWDPSISSDPTTVIVLDVTEKPWVGVYHRHYEKPLDVTQLVGEMYRVHRYYHDFKDPKNWLSVPSKSTCGFDATSMGGQIVLGLLQPLHPKHPVNFGGNATKLPALINLRDLLTRGDIKLPGSWLKVRQELLNYKLKDDKIKQDNVMALMGAGIVASSMTIGRKQKANSASARVTPKRVLRWRN